MAKALTTAQFFRQFPDDETCLTHLFNVRFGDDFACPSCERATRWYRIKAERAYSCQFCGHHLHPTVGTPFARTRTPLQLWFYAIHLFTTTRHGVSGKELERQLGVTYKTAWRMADEIRKHMATVDGDNMLGGAGTAVEVDETGGGRGNYRVNKTMLIGMVERGGDVVTAVVANNRKSSLLPVVKANVRPATAVHTDQNHSYRALPGMGYSHDAVNHNQNEWARGDCHVQTIEGFWRHLKASINGTHIWVSGKHLAKYAKEFEFRFNRRQCPETMLPALLSTFRPLPARSR
jgi:transposase